LFALSNLIIYELQRCNNVERNIKCLHVKFRKRGPKHLDDLYVLFDKAHVIGASAACPGDVSSDESSDDDVVEVRKTDEVKTGKRAKIGFLIKRVGVTILIHTYIAHPIEKTRFRIKQTLISRRLSCVRHCHRSARLRRIVIVEGRRTDGPQPAVCRRGS
jgi:hypothetical protein